jgi:hypothetical protein
MASNREHLHALVDRIPADQAMAAEDNVKRVYSTRYRAPLLMLHLTMSRKPRRNVWLSPRRMSGLSSTLKEFFLRKF